MRFKQRIRKGFKAGLIRAMQPTGQFPTKRTEASEVRALLTELHPVQAGSPLIRLGPTGDGGYLVPDDLDGLAACFSPGVSTRSGFELDCAERGLRVFMADKSVERPALDHELFSFEQKHVGAFSGEGYMTMDEWAGGSGCLGDGAELLLQMDIEGAEYETLLATSEALLKRCRIIVIEMHWLDELWSEPFFRIASRVFRKLLQTHQCVHIHPNNWCGVVHYMGLSVPRVMEFTFHRSDRLKPSGYRTDFPHPLDHANVAQGHEHLPRCWYGGAR